LLHPSVFLEVRKHETDAAIYAGERGIGPRVVYVDANYYVIIMDFVSGTHLTSLVINNQEKLKILLQLIKQLHMSTGHFPTGLTVFERVRIQIRQLEGSEIPFPSKSVQNALNKLKYYEKLFENEPLAPCHNDLNALNIIISENVFKFIDWSDAGMGHVFSDLGFFSLVNCLGEEQDSKVLDLYLERLPSKKEFNLFKHMKIVNTLRIFSNNFAPFEPPIKNVEERMERIAELEKILWGSDLFPISYYLNLHVKGQLNRKELVISTCLSALRSFLELACDHDDA
jgi:thiamine kinase-like enzyme